MIDLEQAPREIWQLLSAGKGRWRLPILATAIAGGGADARTVVLRQVSVNERELIFFSDRRLGKVAQIEADPDVCLVIYDDERDLQVRLYGEAMRENSPTALGHWWNQLPRHQRQVYQVDTPPADSEANRGQDNFAAFRVRVDSFHCLWIRRQGNLAARFNWQDSAWNGYRVRP